MAYQYPGIYYTILYDSTPWDDTPWDELKNSGYLIIFHIPETGYYLFQQLEHVCPFAYAFLKPHIELNPTFWIYFRGVVGVGLFFSHLGIVYFFFIQIPKSYRHLRSGSRILGDYCSELASHLVETVIDVGYNSEL